MALELRGFVLALHIFGVVFWLGGLLMIASLLARVPEEVGLPKERFLGAARGLFEATTNLGAAVTIGLGIVLILIDPCATARMAPSEADAGRDPAFLSRAILSQDHVPRKQSEPVVAPGVSRHPRDGERTADSYPGADSDEAVLAVTLETIFQFASLGENRDRIALAPDRAASGWRAARGCRCAGTDWSVSRPRSSRHRPFAFARAFSRPFVLGL